MRRAALLLLILFVAFSTGNELPGRSATIETGVLVAGGSTGGTAAAIQAARSGVPVVLVEASPWLGGMLTSAGVSATDGNHMLPSGLWGEFRDQIYRYYGGADAVSTGWVSNTLFEPHVGNQIFTCMVRKEDRIIAIHGYHVIKCLMNNNSVVGALFINEDATDTLTVKAQITIDATETGDLLAMAGCNYFTGQDSQQMTGESGAPQSATDIVQDMTYVAILKDYGPGTDNTISKPDNYNPSLYECTCNCNCNNPGEMKYPCDYMLSYGRLPNGKYMINWPHKGNDYYLNDLEMDYYTRKKEWVEAKNHTLGWVYYIQTVAGYANLGLACDEFPTDDLLAFYPYYRESRRLDGVIQLRNGDLSDPYKDTGRAYYQTAVAAGDYPLDLHHKKMPVPITYSLEQISSFSIPYYCLVPKSVNGLLVAEKSISVSHIANGCTRLQPVVMLTGQAAGAAAALCVTNNVEPRDINVRELQQTLLMAGCRLMPYVDITPGNSYFQHIQKVALCGIMRGEGITEGWANRTYFYPDDPVTQTECDAIYSILKGENTIPADFTSIRKDKKNISRSQALDMLLKAFNNSHNITYKNRTEIVSAINKALSGDMRIDMTTPDVKITRKELACWIDMLFDPFKKQLKY